MRDWITPNKAVVIILAVMLGSVCYIARMTHQAARAADSQQDSVGHVERVNMALSEAEQTFAGN